MFKDSSFVLNNIVKTKGGSIHINRLYPSERQHRCSGIDLGSIFKRPCKRHSI